MTLVQSNDVLIPIPSILSLYDKMTMEEEEKEKINNDDENYKNGTGVKKYSIINSLGVWPLYNEYGDEEEEKEEEEEKDKEENEDEDEEDGNDNYYDYDGSNNEKGLDTRNALLDGSYDQNLKICEIFILFDPKKVKNGNESSKFTSELQKTLIGNGSTVYLFIYLYLFSFIYLIIYLFIYLFIIYIFIYLFVYLFICKFIYLFVYLFVYLFNYFLSLFFLISQILVFQIYY
jgi:ABC-type multidrug transport system fused ATPase/permease subunit